jgi:hypothetical protein
MRSEDGDARHESSDDGKLISSAAALVEIKALKEPRHGNPK